MNALQARLQKDQREYELSEYYRKVIHGNPEAEIAWIELTRQTISNYPEDADLLTFIEQLTSPTREELDHVR